MNVLVWNDNEHPFAQDFKGETIKINPKKSVIMEQHEATEFLGKYHPIMKDGGGQQDPRSYKKLRIERLADGSEDAHTLTFTCNKCGISHVTKELLDDHIDANHLDDLPEEVAQKRRGRPRKEA